MANLKDLRKEWEEGIEYWKSGYSANRAILAAQSYIEALELTLQNESKMFELKLLDQLTEQAQKLDMGY